MALLDFFSVGLCVEKKYKCATKSVGYASSRLILSIWFLDSCRSSKAFFIFELMSAMVLSSGKLINVLAKSVSETLGIAAPVLYINICFKKMSDLRKNNK